MGFWCSNQEAHSRIWEDLKDPEDESSFGRIPFQLWNVGKFGSSTEVAIVVLMPPPLLEIQESIPVFG
ncbi:uncharacterized protein A4U43_C10F10380 [Asparagus officinalis]|uniref:Uncharacterized protein n=1 Tax=Asparagus officinalis TaxID=4686 RepID=A0A5P1E1X0_ASPOF|nr:uncharacterized protein A4U43_C10F10380 [Asparagus officinalis]